MELRGRGWMCCLLLGLMCPRTAPAQSPKPTPDWARLQPEALGVLKQYLRINTTNPPGHEEEAARYLATVLDRHGIAARVIPIAAGRAALYARLRGDGSRRPILLLSHIDVVPAIARDWRSPPFAARMVNGELYGRGTVDTKSLGIEELFTLVALKQTAARLHRDVILLATPDEENGSRWGMGWIMRHRRGLIAHAEYVINEGGGVQQFEHRHLVMIEVAQKVPLWVRVIATGHSSHAAVPPPDYSVTRLLDALDGIRRISMPARVTPQVRTMLQALAPYMSDETLRKGFQHPEDGIQQPAFWQALEQRPDFAWYNALLRSTIAITCLQGSNHINTIPTEASARLDCRLLPGDDPGEVLRRIHDAVDGAGVVRLQVLLKGQATSSPIHTDLYRAIAQASQRAWPDAIVVPSLSVGFTDSRFFRELGVKCYGWDAVSLTPAEAGRAHGVNERIRPGAFERALPVLYDAVRQVAE